MQLLKKMLFATIYIFIGMFILSIIFYVLDSKEICSWSNFVFNWLVGTGCSIIVVIITTFIEFKYRQSESLKEIGHILWLITMDFNSLDLLELPDELNEEYNSNNKVRELIDKWSKHHSDSLLSDTRKLVDELSCLEFILHKKVYLKLVNLVITIERKMIDKEDIKEEINKIIDILLELTEKRDNYYWKKYLKEFKNKQ